MTEERRYRLHRKLEETLGDEEAATLMEHLPPYPWDKLAMKEDVKRAAEDLRREVTIEIRRLDEKIDTRFDSLEATTKALHASLEANTESRYASLDEKTEIRFAALNEKMDTFVTAKEFHNTIRVHTLGLVSTSVALFGIAMTLR